MIIRRIVLLKRGTKAERKGSGADYRGSKIENEGRKYHRAISTYKNHPKEFTSRVPYAALPQIFFVYLYGSTLLLLFFVSHHLQMPQAT